MEITWVRLLWSVALKTEKLGGESTPLFCDTKDLKRNTPPLREEGETGATFVCRLRGLSRISELLGWDGILE